MTGQKRISKPSLISCCRRSWVVLSAVNAFHTVLIAETGRRSRGNFCSREAVSFKTASHEAEATEPLGYFPRARTHTPETFHGGFDAHPSKPRAPRSGLNE